MHTPEVHIQMVPAAALFLGAEYENANVGLKKTFLKGRSSMVFTAQHWVVDVMLAGEYSYGSSMLCWRAEIDLGQLKKKRLPY